MEIAYLADRPEFIDTLAVEITRHWSRIYPDETVAARVETLLQHRNRDVLPIAWVAHVDGEVMGTAALRTSDLDVRDHLSPWLAGVFVRDAFRQRGVATALCRVAEAKAWEMGIETLYLFTLDQQRLYSGLGWHHVETLAWSGVECTVMEKKRPERGSAGSGTTLR